MEFLERIERLRSHYDKSKCKDIGTAWLYGLYDLTPPLAEHIVFAPMPHEVMRHMLDSYKRAFPSALLTLYGAMNGADLFWVPRLLGKSKRRLALSHFSLYGVPLTTDRKHVEPFHISIEDLSRPKGTPDNWLKFGSYYMPDDALNRLELFIDTESNRVFATKHGSDVCRVTAEWESLDSALCEIFDTLAATLLR